MFRIVVSIESENIAKMDIFENSPTPIFSHLLSNIFISLTLFDRADSIIIILESLLYSFSGNFPIRYLSPFDNSKMRFSSAVRPVLDDPETLVKL